MTFEEFRDDVRRRMGVNIALANQRIGCGCIGLLGGVVFLFWFWPLGLALLLISFLFQIVGNQRSGSERAAMAVADAEALRLWEERKYRLRSESQDDPLARSAKRILSSLEEALAVGERLSIGRAKAQRAAEAEELLEELFVICEEIAFISQVKADELEWRVAELSRATLAQPASDPPEPESDL